MATRYKIHKYLFLLIFLSSPEVLAADSLGRLFLTPEQRTQLDTARAQRDRRLPVQETEAGLSRPSRLPKARTSSPTVAWFAAATANQPCGSTANPSTNAAARSRIMKSASPACVTMARCRWRYRRPIAGLRLRWGRVCP